MYSFQKEYDLKAHSPLIHFQYDSNGATLRATEVKPKLDRYILKHCKDIPKKWIRDNVNGKISLDYKLRIIATESKPPFNIGRRTDYDIYYGNMGDGAQIKKGVMNNAKLTVTCFHEDLLGYIDKIIGDFFIVTNFGTMQSKGFGSFTVDGKDNSKGHIYDVLRKEYADGGYCYGFKPTDKKLTFRQIKMIYSIMKSGQNLTRVIKIIKNGNHTQREIHIYPKTTVVNGKDYSDLYYHRSLLYQYLRKEKDMGNEKAWMKKMHIVPTLDNLGRYAVRHDKPPIKLKPSVKMDDGTKFKDRISTRIRRSKHKFSSKSGYYVRALLGIGETIEYQAENGSKVKVTIKETSETIERLNSPILFKVIDDMVYFVGQELNERIYGKKFSFSSSMKKGRTRRVPKKDELPCNFMNGFMEYCFNELNGYFDKIREYFRYLKIYDVRNYNALEPYEKNFRDTLNITILRGKIKSE